MTRIALVVSDCDGTLLPKDKILTDGSKNAVRALHEAVGAEATAVRSQTYYLDVTPAGYDKGTFAVAMAKRLGISLDAVATIGDMQNDLPMFAKSGVSFAMGNATGDVKQHATHI